MKKLTKRVQAGGLWFDVPVDTTHVAVQPSGHIFAFNGNAPTICCSGDCWVSLDGDSFLLPRVDLEGEDWRECCWYVRDQTDGEAVERREWMARGVEKSIELISAHSWDESEGDGIVAATDAMEIIAAKIRAREVDL